MSYKFKEPPASPTFGPLPEGDYLFMVASVDEPYEKNEHWILPVKLAIEPEGVPVFANPWAGVDKNGNERDGIAEFLVAINRAPAPGKEPDWQKVVGAKGKCRLKVEIAKKGALEGKGVNKVHYFYSPKQIGPERAPEKKTYLPKAQPQHKEVLLEPDDDIPY